MKKTLFLALFFGWMHVATAVDYFSPRTAGLGGAGRAGPIGTDAIYLSPAIASFQKTYAATVAFHGYSGRDDSEPKGRVAHASILDGTNSFFQAGVGYTNRADAKMIHFGASKALTQWLGFGIGAKRMFNRPGYQNQHLFNASAIVDILPFLKAAVMADNLNENRESQRWNLYREYGAGLKFNLANLLLLYYDPTYSPNRPGGRFGASMAAELMVFQGFYVRYGMNRGTMQPHLGTFGRGIGYGAGFLFPKIAFDFSIYRTMAPMYTSGKVFSTTLSF